jgi:hypothetical protein
LPILRAIDALPAWPQRIREVVADAASEVLPQRASLRWSPPSDTDSVWHLALVPVNDGATALHLFVGTTEDGTDAFEVGSRAASFELWRDAEERVDEIRELVSAFVAGRCTEETGYVGADAKTVEMRIELKPGAVTRYSVSRRPAAARALESLRRAERVETTTYDPF